MPAALQRDNFPRFVARGSLPARTKRATSELSKSKPRGSGRCAGAGPAKPLLQTSGAPPGFRTRRCAFLRRVRMPIPPAGKKKPGDLAAQPGLGENATCLCVTFLPRPGLRARSDCRARARARLRAALALPGCMSSRSILSSSPHSSSSAFTRKQRKPGALARSGPRSIAQCATRTPLPDTRGPRCSFAAIRSALPLVNAVSLILPLRYWARIVLMANLTVDPMDSEETRAR